MRIRLGNVIGIYQDLGITLISIAQKRFKIFYSIPFYSAKIYTHFSFKFIFEILDFQVLTYPHVSKHELINSIKH